jgi:hypothetical protein
VLFVESQISLSVNHFELRFCAQHDVNIVADDDAPCSLASKLTIKGKVLKEVNGPFEVFNR